MVRGDVGAHIGQQVGAVAGVRELRFQPRELGAVLREDLAVTRQVGGFQGAWGWGGVEQAGEVRKERGSLERVSVGARLLGKGLENGSTASRVDWSCSSRACSSSLGLLEMSDREAYWA